MGHKTTESNHNVNNICNGGSRSFTKETSLEDEEHSDQPSEVDNNSEDH